MPAQLPTRDGPRVNEEIRVPQVRLIDQNGEMLGVMSAREALIRAYDVGLDLLEISPETGHVQGPQVQGARKKARVSLQE